jgi:hypothetical protein
MRFWGQLAPASQPAAEASHIPDQRERQIAAREVPNYLMWQPFRVLEV